ncbi:MAG: hypothetical protein A2Y12_06335 [Planctomycetes bacterium GWF2_42_9]|nr:MAG: hypothetical protein A2Y12_06335 [Planctomycetes bacterium GWF2_42_9]
MRESAPEITFLSLKDIADQLKICEDKPILHAMVATYIYAGLRREEAMWLTRDDVDLDSRLIRIRAKTVDGQKWQPKTKRNRAVPISDVLYEILNGYRPPVNCTWFFPSTTGKRWDTDNFSQDLREINNKNNLKCIITAKYTPAKKLCGEFFCGSF